FRTPRELAAGDDRSAVTVASRRGRNARKAHRREPASPSRSRSASLWFFSLGQRPNLRKPPRPTNSAMTSPTKVRTFVVVMTYPFSLFVNAHARRAWSESAYQD